MANRRDQDDSEERETGRPELAEEQTGGGGRPVTVEHSPEGDLMQIRSISTLDADPLSTEATEAAADDIDERAARDARMAVRRQEHSAD